MNLKFLLLGTTLALLAADTSIATDANDLPLLTPKVKTIAAFKNGLAFVLKSGETPLKEGWARMEEVPPATLGSLWIASKSGAISDVVAYKEKVATDVEAISLGELMEANVGEKVIVTTLSGNLAKTIEGTLVAVPRDRKANSVDLSGSEYPGSALYGRSPAIEPTRGEIILLRTKNTEGHSSLLSLAKSSVTSLEIVDGANIRTNTVVEKERARTKIRVGGNPAQAEISVACLEKGIVWSPSYRINIANDKVAEIELEALFANDMEDLDRADISFVVGFPNFSFADVLSPISLQQNVAAFVQAMASAGNPQAGRFGNVMSQAVLYNSARFDGSTSPDAGYSAGSATPGEQGEDLYFYHKNGVTMKKGNRAVFSLLKTSAPYEHIYQWEVPDSMNIDDRGYRNNQQQPKAEDFVWHCLRLDNKGKQPWTTAPAFAISGTLPIAQDTLHYTPPGGRSFLKLTVATDVRPEQTQTETGRHQVSLSDRHYDEITVSGKLRLTNWKDKEISILIRKSISGEVITSPDGKVSKVARNLTSVNPSSEVEWEFKLAPGKNRELTYEYKVLIAR